MAENDVEESRAIENLILRIDDAGIICSENVTLRLDILDTGSWIIKFREIGVICNNRELMFNNCVTADAMIVFSSCIHLWAIFHGSETINDNEVSENLKQIGSTKALEYFWNRLLSKSANLNNIITTSKPLILNKPSILPSDHSHAIKSGWLYKRRDIITGWRCRYFSVYIGRLEYFVDAEDILPRGVVPLFGAEVIGPRKCNVNGVSDHWCLTVAPKNRDKSFRLASEHCGEGGIADTNAWVEAFTRAAQVSESVTTNPASSNTTTTSPAINILKSSLPFRHLFPQRMKSSTMVLSASGSASTSASTSPTKAANRSLTTTSITTANLYNNTPSLHNNNNIFHLNNNNNNNSNNINNNNSSVPYRNYNVNSSSTHSSENSDNDNSNNHNNIKTEKDELSYNLTVDPSSRKNLYDIIKLGLFGVFIVFIGFLSSGLKGAFLWCLTLLFILFTTRLYTVWK